jgi:hypothetical protein
MNGAPEPGWYPDPEDGTVARYWDGREWTEQRRPFPQGPLGGGGGYGHEVEPYAAGTPYAGPPGAGAVLPPPKRGMSTGAKVLLGILAGFLILTILVVGGCVACGALVFTAVDEELTDRDYGNVRIGQPIEIRGVRYTVTDVETGPGSAPRSQRRTPAGSLIVALEVEKPGGAPGALSRNQFQLETDAGDQIPIDDRLQDRLQRALPFQPIEAGSRVAGQIAFAVRPGEIRNARLRIEAVLGNGHGYIDLD